MVVGLPAKQRPQNEKFTTGPIDVSSARVEGQPPSNSSKIESGFVDEK
jgi:hypothetical protein